MIAAEHASHASSFFEANVTLSQGDKKLDRCGFL
jgi:hypothetical protein